MDLEQADHEMTVIADDEGTEGVDTDDLAKMNVSRNVWTRSVMSKRLNTRRLDMVNIVRPTLTCAATCGGIFWQVADVPIAIIIAVRQPIFHGAQQVPLQLSHIHALA